MGSKAILFSVFLAVVLLITSKVAAVRELPSSSKFPGLKANMNCQLNSPNGHPVHGPYSYTKRGSLTGGGHSGYAGGMRDAQP
ncbi:Hypothetical predicted protein [Olea europaea subsp. europaea]|uniref:Uncharacterized protein n=1 Tax=Olea europaea subsp. europaea TaxID=158383 RepID=A0A8S0TW14_OLEEU|nr:Hypothetical predicted protein [Olea europaea subsp. europaea]